MTKQAIIECKIRVLNHLPEDKAEEIYDFAAFIIKLYEESVLTLRNDKAGFANGLVTRYREKPANS